MVDSLNLAWKSSEATHAKYLPGIQKSLEGKVDLQSLYQPFNESHPVPVPFESALESRHIVLAL